MNGAVIHGKLFSTRLVVLVFSGARRGLIFTCLSAGFAGVWAVTGPKGKDWQYLVSSKRRRDKKFGVE
jgi:hypothetical protein